MRLILPVPPSPNRWKAHPIARQVQKDEYRKEAWVAALAQHKPTRDPPEHVEVSVTFYFARRMRDADNLQASLKWVLDALRQRQDGGMRWRQGVAHLCGYLVDDDPGHMTLGEVRQERVRTKGEERIEVELVPVQQSEAA